MELHEFNYMEDDTIYASHSLFHHEYYIIHNNEKIGEIQLTFEKDFVTIALFKIYKEFRGKGYSKLLDEVILNEIKSSKYTPTTLFLTSNPYDDGGLDNNQLIKLYEKYFNMVVYFADSTETLMKKEI